MTKESIRRKIIIPLALLLFFLYVVTVIGFYQTKKTQIIKSNQEHLKSVNKALQQKINDDSQFIGALIDFIKEDKNLQKAWLAKDRDELLKHSMPILESLHSEADIDQFYFHGLDQINFLRVHKPSNYGDFIDRFTLKEASEKQKTSYGIELGLYEFVALRVVKPWRINGELTGYIELTEDMHHLMPRLKNILGGELILLINKKYLNRSKWEEGQQLMRREANWDSLKYFIIFESTTGYNKTLIDEIKQYYDHEHAYSSTNFTYNNRRYIAGDVSLTDAGGSVVGSIIVLYDITDMEKSILKLTLVVFLISILSGFILFIFFYRYLGNIENKILKLNNDLCMQVENHKKGEKEIKKQYDFMNNVFESLTYPFYIINTDDYTIELANSAAHKVGIFESSKCYICIHKSNKPCENDHLCPLAEVKRTKQAVTVEHIHYDINNNPRTVEVKGYPLFDDERNITRIIEYSLDITERKRSEAELVRLSKAVEQSDEAIVVTDMDGIIYYTNPSFERITGYTQLEAIGQNPRLLKSGQQDAAFYKELWETISGGNVWKGHFVNKKKDGTLYNEEATISPIKNAKGSITSYVAVKRDVTKELMQEEQLHHSQKMEAVGTLAGGIAHDFNNILGGMLGFAEIAKDEVPKESPAQYYLEQTIKLGERAANLVKQILSFSRKTGSTRNPIQLSPLIKEALNLLRASLPTTIEIRQKLMDQGSMVEADPTQMHQVLMNLCTNASYAMQEKGGVLEVYLTRITVSLEDIVAGQNIEPGPYVQLRVSDTGTGIDPAIINRIFDPFFTTKEVNKGTGLGLSVVHGIIKAHGGDIKVLSQPGKGTTFSILLPEVSPSAEIEQEDNNTALQTGNEHILFVDDEETMTVLAKKMLEPLGYKVTAVQSSKEALEIFQNNPEMFDLVITDLTMPHMTGYELSKELIKFRPDMPVILCTGYNETILNNKEKEQYVKAVLIKPVNRRVLSEMIRKVLHTQ